jgi:hypothetical protein
MAARLIDLPEEAGKLTMRDQKRHPIIIAVIHKRYTISLYLRIAVFFVFFNEKTGTGFLLNKNVCKRKIPVLMTNSSGLPFIWMTL